MGRRMKHTDIGDIPADWKLQTFEETFRVLSNNTLSRENLNNKGGAVRNIHYGDILTKFPEVLNCNEEDIPYLNDLSLITANTQLLQDGDVVIADTAEDDTVGKTIEVQNLGNGKLVAGLHTIPCRVKKGDFAPGWLGYYMNSYIYHDQIIPFITGIKVSSISKTAIAETIILVPPVEEQERIVETLSQLDSLIKQETSVSEKLNNVKSSCLSKIFPKDDEKKPEMRFPEFNDTWEQRKVGEWGNFYYGHSCPKWSVTEDATTPCIRYGEMYTKFGCKIDRVYSYTNIPKENLKFSKGTEVLVPRVGEDPMDYNHCTWLSLANVAIGEMISVYNTEQNPLFTAIMFNATLKYEFAKRVEGGSVTNLYYEKLLEIPVSFPNIEEQKKIASLFENFDHLITLHQRKCDKYKSIKAGLIRKLFP